MDPIQIIKTLQSHQFSQSVIAEKAGTTQATISRIAAGKVPDPSWSVVRGVQSAGADLLPDVFGSDANANA